MSSILRVSEDIWFIWGIGNFQNPLNPTLNGLDRVFLDNSAGCLKSLYSGGSGIYLVIGCPCLSRNVLNSSFSLLLGPPASPSLVEVSALSIFCTASESNFFRFFLANAASKAASRRPSESRRPRESSDSRERRESKDRWRKCRLVCPAGFALAVPCGRGCVQSGKRGGFGQCGQCGQHRGGFSSGLG